MKKSNNTKGLALRIMLGLFFLLGCARVTIESKKPIQLDVKMRVDVYQHVAQDVNAIEDMISSPSGTEKGLEGGVSLLWRIAPAYAQGQEDYPENVQAAIERRKDRRDEIGTLESQGVLGENSKGLLELRKAGDRRAEDLVREENADRRIIYAHVAQKNDVPVEETARVFSKRIQADAPAGTPLEGADGRWVTK